jgi:hypothetical protein
MKLVIKNKTHWRTRDLRRFMLRCMKQEGLARAEVTVTYNRQVRGACSGRAWLHSPYARIMVPSQEIDRADLAQTIAHEFGHCMGLTHADMRDDSRYRRVGGWRERYAWANELPLEKVAPKQKPRPTADVKLAHAQAMLQAWRSKLKRTHTHLKKWERKVRYYERAATATRP